MRHRPTSALSIFLAMALTAWKSPCVTCHGFCAMPPTRSWQVIRISWLRMCVACAKLLKLLVPPMPRLSLCKPWSRRQLAISWPILWRLTSSSNIWMWRSLNSKRLPHHLKSVSAILLIFRVLLCPRFITIPPSVALNSQCGLALLHLRKMK